MLWLFVFLVGAAALVGCGGGKPSRDPESDKTAIEAALRQWPNDFNAENFADIREMLVDGALPARWKLEDPCLPGLYAGVNGLRP